MTAYQLHNKYFVHEVTEQSKGKGKKRRNVKVHFNENFTRRDYLNELAAIDMIACGMFLCRVEFNELTEDRWWDVPEYRDEHLRQYRGRITAIRKQYGLTSKDIKQFMRVA